MDSIPESKVITRVIEEEMKSSYLDYSMSVIVGRALPDVRDGLKPVHRRVLYTMYESGLLHNKPFKKCANAVGTCMARYHPHGDSPIYEALVRLAQDFSMRYPLIKGQGNFGSIDGDSPAAMRYTECRLNKLSEEMLQDLDKETVGFVPNFDGSMKEPVVLPSKIPNLLVNGSSGIAVGMATNIPPHNLTEVCHGVIYLIDNPAATVDELMKLIPAPDFPTGGLLAQTASLKDAYTTGRGKLTVRAKTLLEEKKGRTKIVVSEIPYMVNKSVLIEQIADLIRDKKVVGVSDLRDESDRDGIRVVLELKSGINSDIVLNQLFAHSNLQVTFGVIMLALVDNAPRVLGLKDLLQNYADFRQEIVRKRTAFELREAERKEHVLAGLVIALENIDGVIKLIRSSRSVKDARTGLMADLVLTEIQANAILEMRLSRLTALEQEEVKTDLLNTRNLIVSLKDVLASDEKIKGIVKGELMELIEKYGDARRTQLVQSVEEYEEEQLIKPEDVIITLTHNGYVKRISTENYRKQKRGGKGVVAAEATELDPVETLFVANTRNSLLFFTTKGKVHWLKVYQIPEAGRYARGTAVVNLLQLDADEKITASIPISEFVEENFIMMVTKKGVVKKTSLSEFSSPRKGGILAVGLDEGDELVNVLLTDGSREVVIGTEKGTAVHFHEKDVRQMGRTAYGVRGIRLREGDVVVGAVLVEKGKTILTITALGYGKRTPFEEYTMTRRGGVGVINVKITEKNGRVVTVLSVGDDDEFMVITQSGVALRSRVKEISTTGRNAQGVRVMRIEPNDCIVSAAKLVSENGDEVSSEVSALPPSPPQPPQPPQTPPQEPQIPVINPPSQQTNEATGQPVNETPTPQQSSEPSSSIEQTLPQNSVPETPMPKPSENPIPSTPVQPEPQPTQSQSPTSAESESPPPTSVQPSNENPSGQNNP